MFNSRYNRSGGCNGGQKQQQTTIPEVVFQATGARAEYIHLMCNLGFNFDNNNEPALENILIAAPAESTMDGNKKAKWGWDGVLTARATTITTTRQVSTE